MKEKPFEYAERGHERPSEVRGMIGILDKLRASRVPCELCRGLRRATSVISQNGEAQIVCKTCAGDVAITRQMRRMREEITETRQRHARVRDLVEETRNP